MLFYNPPSELGQPSPADELKREIDKWEDAPDLEALKSATDSVGAFAFATGNADAAPDDVEHLVITNATVVLNEDHTLPDVEVTGGTLEARAGLSMGTLA